MTLQLQAQKRDLQQSNKKLRQNGQIPCSMYGKNVDSTNLLISRHILQRCLKEGSRKVSIELDGKSYLASIEEAQREPASSKLLHVSFHAFNKNDQITMQVPLRLEGKAKGVLDGGALHHSIQTLTVQGRAGDIPEELVLDVTSLELGSSLHVSDLNIHGNIEIKEAAEITLVACNFPKLQKIEDEAAATIEAPVEEIDDQESAA